MLGLNKTSIILAVLGLCLFAGLQARSISMMGDVKIDISDDKFICDKIECPLHVTARCVVTKEKESENSTVLVRTDTCYSDKNEVLKKSETKETVDAHDKIKVHIEATADGMISSSYNSYSSSNFDKEKFDKEMESFENHMEQQMENLHHNMDQMQEQLSHMFD